jgi:hypothetical protein
VAVLVSRPERLTPFGGAVAPTDDRQLSRAATSEDVEVQLYITAYAPSAASAYLAVDQVVTDIDGDTTLSGPARAGRIAREVLPPLRSCSGTRHATRPPPPRRRAPIAPGSPPCAAP